MALATLQCLSHTGQSLIVLLSITCISLCFPAGNKNVSLINSYLPLRIAFTTPHALHWNNSKLRTAVGRIMITFYTPMQRCIFDQRISALLIYRKGSRYIWASSLLWECSIRRRSTKVLCTDINKWWSLTLLWLICTCSYAIPSLTEY